MENLKNDLIATEARSEHTGAITLWTLKGDTDLTELADAWEKEGLKPEHLPSLVSPEVALSRAATALRAANCLVTKHEDGGWAVVGGFSVAQAELKWSGIVRYDLVGDQLHCFDTEGRSFHVTEGLVAETFAKALSVLSTDEISPWLVTTCVRLGGTKLKKSGGTYFLPPSALAEFDAIERAVAAVSEHSINPVPVVRSSQMLKLAVEAVQAEAVEEAAKIEKVLNNQGARATTLHGQVLRCREVIAKIEGYEQLLGAKIGNAVELIQGLKKQLEVAIATKGSSRIELLEVDGELTPEEIAKIDAAAKAAALKIAERKAALEAPRPQPVAAAPVAYTEEELTRFSGLEID